MTEPKTTSSPTPAPLPVTQTPGQVGRYARNDPATFAAGEETTPEKDAAERGQPGSFGDEEPKA